MTATIVGLKKKAKQDAAAANGKTPVNAKAEPTVLGIVPKGDLEEVELSLIDDPPGIPDRMQRHDDKEHIEEVARSLREVGQLQPVMVEMDKDAKRFTRVFGRRRILAAKLNAEKHGGKKTILAIVVAPLEPDVRRTIVAVENIQRKDLSPAEEHLAVAELLELQAKPACEQMKISPVPQGDAADLLAIPAVRARACELVAAMLAKSPTWVRDRMYIGRLGKKGRDLVLAGKLPILHAREICKVADPQIREDLAESYAAGGDDSVSDTEAGHYEDLENEVRQRLFNLKVVPWELAVPFAGCRECDGCPSNSATNPGLFEHGGEGSDTLVAGLGRDSWRHQPKTHDTDAVCTDHRCYATKLKAAKAAVSAAAKRIVDGDKKPSQANVPAFVAEQALSAKIKDRRESKKSAGRRPKQSVQSPKPKGAKEIATENAENVFDDAMIKWTRTHTPAVTKAINSKPGAWALLKILLDTKAAEATEHHDIKQRRKAMRNPELLGLINVLSTPNWDGLLKLEKACGRNYGLFQFRHDQSGIVELIAKALGLKLDPAPDYDQVFAAELKKAGVKEEPANPKAKLPEKGKASKKPAAEVDGGEDDPEDDE